MTANPDGWSDRIRATSRTSATAAVFVGLFAVTNAAAATRGPTTRQAWLGWASTNLDNLATHPIGALVASAFVDDGAVLDWIVLGLVALVCAGSVLGNLRAAALVTVAHVLGTAVSEGILAIQIGAGSAPESDRSVLDIGPSYVVVAALTVGIVYGRWPARIASSVAFLLLAPHLFGGLTHLAIAPVGHCCAIATGLTLGLVFRRSRRSQVIESGS